MNCNWFYLGVYYFLCIFHPKNIAFVRCAINYYCVWYIYMMTKYHWSIRPIFKCVKQIVIFDMITQFIVTLNFVCFYLKRFFFQFNRICESIDRSGSSGSSIRKSLLPYQKNIMNFQLFQQCCSEVNTFVKVQYENNDHHYIGTIVWRGGKKTFMGSI